MVILGENIGTLFYENDRLIISLLILQILLMKCVKTLELLVKKDVTNMTENKYQFEKLTPIDNKDLDIYKDALDFVFDNADIKNVAISGAYSSGKSSLLASYKKSRNDLHFMHISLAHFESPNQEEKNRSADKSENKNESPFYNDRNKVNESVLEGKILNQLIHQIPSDKIPQTNFRVKKKTSSKSIIIMTITTVLLILAIAYFVFFSSWKGYVSALPDNRLKTFLSLSIKPYGLMIDGLIIISLLFFIIYELLKIQKNKNVFRKLNLQGNEIEIFEERDDSYFDKYLNEVIYLFENAEADVIVFEDMDRFNANRIFERLREINTLANIQLQKVNKTLRFFYLLRDDIFVSKDRTKFFDFIIPVVPVIDSSNSCDQFISIFKKGGLFEKFDKSFLQGLSLYIDDMRLLKNIYNEFLIYYDILNTIDLDCNKMLAIITYKNLFPSDFADLQLNKGFVYTIFRKKDDFIEKEIGILKEKIDEKSKQIEMAQNEHLKSIHELNTVFAHEYLNNYNWERYNQNDLNNFISRYLNGNDLNEYSKRRHNLDNRLNDRVSIIEREKSMIEKKIAQVYNKQLHNIITRQNISSIFSVTSTNEIEHTTYFNQVKSSDYFDLLKYLIRNGYIDETYSDYMTYFYENSLSIVDKIFLRSVTDKKAREYTYKLKNPELVIYRLRLMDFDQEEILNFDLLTYLLSTLSHNEYLDRFIDQLKETKNFNFIGAYFDRTTELSAFIKYLNIRWPQAFSTALEEHALTREQIRKYSICSIYYSDDDTLELVNKDNCLCDYISNSRDYLTIENPKVDRLIHCFTLLDVCFINFDYEKLNKDLFHAVYEESLYEINAENLQLMQREILRLKNDEDIFHKNYTLLLSHSDSAITKYINQNISDYFNVVLTMSCGTIFDDENVAVAVLNNSSIIAEQKYSYIRVLQTVITSINEVEDSSLWPLLLDTNTILYSEQNIMDYFNAIKVIDKSMISFINRYNDDLDFSKTEYDNESKKALFNNVIVCNYIENSKYEQILVSLKLNYNFNTSDISNDKVTILIDRNIIIMTANNLKFMRKNYSNQVFYFIQKNIDEYVDIMDSNLFAQSELLEIITWNISDELKFKLLEFSNDEISIIGQNYSTEVCIYILKNNFMQSDLNDLFSSFDNWNEYIQIVIFDFAINNIRRIINNPKPVSEKLKDRLIRSERLNREVKINLLIAMMPNINKDYVKEILILLDLTDYVKIFDTRSRPKFEINDMNEKLLEAFKTNNWIEDFKEDFNKDGYYKIVRKKLNNVFLK